jgi:enoyl-CoA hydratase/carnithine racemase
MTAITEPVALDRRGRVAVLTVDNPPGNALGHRASSRHGKGRTECV